MQKLTFQQVQSNSQTPRQGAFPGFGWDAL